MPTTLDPFGFFWTTTQFLLGGGTKGSRLDHLPPRQTLWPRVLSRLPVCRCACPACCRIQCLALLAQARFLAQAVFKSLGARFSPMTSPTKMKSHGKTQKPSMLEFMGLAGNFSHLNLKDPFHVKKRGSSYQTEVRAGVTTFLAMAYILPVNSGMLSLVIPNMRQQLVCATALASFLGCWFMGILSNYPFMLAPGMGTNAFFTFSVCMGMGLTYEEAFAAVFCAGLIFMTLSITGLRTLMIRLFPEGIKESIGAGVGLFLCFIAYQSSEGMGVSVADKATLVTLNSLSSSNYDSSKLWLSLAVLILTATLFAAKVPGAPLVGIIFGTAVTWVEGWCRGVEGSMLGYPFGTEGDRSVEDFHIYVPTGLLATPTLEGLSGALWSGFSAAANEKAATFWGAAQKIQWRNSIF